jgi:DNA modification methylase
MRDAQVADGAANRLKGNERAPRLPYIEESESSEAVEERSGFNDPAFASNKLLPIHRWVPWIAGFSSDFVSDALARCLSGRATVLDPFCGVGTTLVEAVEHGHDAIGFEINPYAALASRIKANAHLIRLDSLLDESSRFALFYAQKASDGYVPSSRAPAGFKTRAEFYSPKVLRKVLIVQDFISSIEEQDLRDLFELAFASTMVRYSNYSYEPSLGRRVAAGKQEIEDFPVGQEIARKLREIAEDVGWLQSRMPGHKPRSRVINASFFECAQHVAPRSVDLVITSPPYLNNYHYNRNTRPQLYWLGFARQPSDFNHLEHSNFGKFWQTVREQERLNLEFDLPGTDLTERLEALRRLNPHKGIYGGSGWANYAAAYFNDCRRFAEGLKYVLRPGGTALVVIGNSILQGVLIPTDAYFGKIAEAVGLELVRIDIPRSTRVGNSIIKSDVRVAKAQDKHQLYEAVVELRKR